MLFLLVNTILILCNPAPNPLCQVWVKSDLKGEGMGGAAFSALAAFAGDEPVMLNLFGQTIREQLRS
jgi:hypothetical protein